MNSAKSFALQVHRDAIAADLVVENIIDKLLSKFVIDEEDKGLIDKENNERDKARCLLDVLIAKDDQTYEKFKEILEPDYSWLAKLLEQDSSSEEWIQIFQQDALTLGGVPREPPNYVERTDILKMIRDHLLSLERSSFLMLHGMPGSGKSCLARSAICDRDVLNKMSNRVYWCNVGECTTKEQIQQHLHRLYNKVQSDIMYRDNRPASVLMSEKLEHLHDTLKALFTRNEFRNTLLVLDDVRDSETLNMFDLGCKVLLTSKNKEILRNINSKEAKTIPVKDFTEAESVQLFANCMGVKVDVLTPQQSRHLKTIHHLCRGLPMVIALIGGQLKLSYKIEESRIERMVDCIHRLEKHELFSSSNHIFPAIDICIRDLSDELKQKFHTMVLFLEDVNIPSSVLQLLWGETKYRVEDIMTELKNRSLVLGEFNVENKEFVYGLHDLLLAYLKNRLGPSDIRNMHIKLIETYCQKCGGDFSKLPNDNYIYSYLGYHFEEADLPLPDIYLDLNFIGAKIRATSSADLLVDFARYEDKIVKNDPIRKLQLTEMEQFVKDCGYNLYRYPDLCIVQLALTWRSSGFLKVLAQDVVKNNPHRLFLDVWYKEKGPPRAQILELPSVPLVACFTIDTNHILVGYNDGSIQMWDLDYYRVRANFTGTSQSVTYLKINPNGDSFLSLSANGEGYLWNIPTNLSHSNSALNGPMNGSPSPIVRQRPWNSLHDTDCSQFSPLHHFKNNDGYFYKYACFTNNGECLCLCSENGFINVHNVSTGQTIANLKTEIENVISCCFYKMNYVMLGTANKDIWLFDLRNKIMGKFQCTEESTSLLSSRMEKVISVTPTSIAFFHYEEMKELLTGIACISAAIILDADILVIGGEDSITVYEIKYDDLDEISALEIMHHIPDLSGPVKFVDAYQNGPSIYILASNNIEAQIKIWCLQPGDFAFDYNKTARMLPIFDCIFDPLPVTPEPKDHTKTLSQQLSNNGKLDPMKLGNILNTFSPSSPRHSVNFQLVVADNNNKLQMMRGHTLTNSDVHDNKITCITISTCGLIIGYGLDNGYIYVYEIKTRKSKKVLKLPTSVTYLEFFDNLKLIAADERGTLMVWVQNCPIRLQGDIKKLQETESERITSKIDHNPGSSNVKFSYTDKIIKCFAFDLYIISISENCSMKCWDYDNIDYKLVSVLWGKHSTASRVTCACLQKSNFALGQDNGLFMYFILEYVNKDNEEKKQLRARCKGLKNVNKSIQCIDISLDASIIALGLADGDIILWSTIDNIALKNLKLHKSAVRYLAFTSNYYGVSPMILLSGSDVVAWWNISYCLSKYLKKNVKRPEKTNQGFSPEGKNMPATLDLKNIANVDFWTDKIGPEWKPELIACIKLQGKYVHKVVANNSYSAFVTVDESGQFYLMRLK